MKSIDQFQRDRDFKKCWGCAGHRDSGHYFDLEVTKAEKVSGSVVGLNGSDGLGDELRYRIHGF